MSWSVKDKVCIKEIARIASVDELKVTEFVVNHVATVEELHGFVIAMGRLPSPEEGAIVNKGGSLSNFIPKNARSLSAFSVEDLQAEIDRRKKSEWPELGDMCYYIDVNLQVDTFEFISPLDLRYMKGNCFKTESEAEAAAGRVKMALKGQIMTAEEAIDFATHVSDDHRDEVAKKFVEYTEGDQ